MSWYKQSKLVDFNSAEDVPTYVYCEKCKKWATQGRGEKGSIWKAYYEMDPDEQAEMDQSYKLFNTGHSRVKSTVCDKCSEE